MRVRATAWMMVVLALAAGARAADAPVEVVNFAGGETIRHPVAILRGEVPADAKTISVINTSSNRDTRQMTGIVHKGRFKALAELVPGVNRLVLRTEAGEATLAITYAPQTNGYFVRCVYHTDSTGDTAYQSPLDNDPQDYAAKLDTAMKLMQAFTAERLHDLGYGRRTFNLEFDDDGTVRVHVVKGREAAEAYYAVTDVAWYGKVDREMREAFPGRKAKNFVVAAYTRYDPATKKARGHTALGGGSLGLFGSGNLFTWPSRLQDVQKAFMDDRRIDPAKALDDSAGRSTFWGAASTTIGASLHEMSHTFNLPHTNQPMDIMTRGFDRFNRAFTFVDPPSGHSAEPREFGDDRIACFPPISADALVLSRWMTLDEKPYGERGGATIKLDAEKGIVIESRHPIGFIGFRVRGDAVHHIVPKEPATTLAIPLSDVEKHLREAKFGVQVIDREGTSSYQDLTRPAAP